MILSRLVALVGILVSTIAIKIEFFNGAEYGGPSIQQDIVFDKCLLIPDSNAKGDSGSSVAVSRREPVCVHVPAFYAVGVYHMLRALI